MASELTRNGRVTGYRRDDLEINPPYLYPDYASTRTRAPNRPLVPASWAQCLRIEGSAPTPRRAHGEMLATVSCTFGQPATVP